MVFNFSKKTFCKKDEVEIIEYKIENKTIILPRKHPLPQFQSNYRLYDKFLPFLVDFLGDEGLIIDVGANVGDSLFSMIDHCKNLFYCIEPSHEFYNYLKLNISKLELNSQDRILTFQTLVGTGDFNGYLEKQHGGTAKLIIDKNKNINNIFIRLDDLIPEKSEVILIKVDTDGFDFDVIFSAKRICSEHKPILFWENEITDDFQLKGFENLYLSLTNLGYDVIYVFDNFGNILLELSDFECLKQINNYLFTMIDNNCTRTFHYTDVLASTNKHKPILETAVKNYKSHMIYKMG